MSRNRDTPHLGGTLDYAEVAVELHIVVGPTHHWVSQRAVTMADKRLCRGKMAGDKEVGTASHT
jgi:hypothetical protein